MIMHRNIADWHGQLEDEDVETDGPWFGTLRMEADERFQADESSLYHDYQLNYRRPETESG